MSKWKRRLTALLTAAALTLTAALPVFAKEYTDEEKELYAYYLNEVVDLLDEEYKFELPKDQIYKVLLDRLMQENPELLEELIGLAVNQLDEHSMYFKRDELKSFMETTAGTYVGIGVTVERRSGYVTISAVTPDSPAQKAGILVDDKIASIDGVDAKSFDVATAREHIRGEAGTAVRLGIVRGDEYLEFEMLREEVDASPVEYNISEDKIGYLSIAQFNDLAVIGVSNALAAFGEQDVTDIVVDLRDNPGGTLQSVLEILAMFVPDGMTLVKVDFKDDRKDSVITSNAKFREPKYNLAVLINGGTASAAEVFTGAILDNKLGVVVGETSYGKATIQEFMGLISFGDMNLGDIKLTVGEYQTPSGEYIHHRGIGPNVKVKNSSTPIDLTGMEPFEYRAQYKKGDTGKGILAIKQRLAALNYPVGELDEEFDEELEVAVTSFQRNVGLYPYGVMDITTQTYLENGIKGYRRENDDQLDMAIYMLQHPEEMQAAIHKEKPAPEEDEAPAPSASPEAAAQ